MFLILIGICASLFSTSLTSLAYADIGEAYGFGARSAGLAGAATAWGADAYAAYANAAAMSLKPAYESPDSAMKRLKFSIGMLWMDPIFKSIDGITTQNTYTYTSVSTGSVDVNYRPAFGTAIGASYLLFPDFHRIAVGMTAFLPIQATTYIDSGEPYLPEFVLYRSRFHRPQLDIGLSGEIFDGFYFGLGIHTGFSLTTSADAVLQATPNPSYMRFSSSLKPRITPALSLYYTPTTQNRLTFGLLFRAATPSDAYTNFRSLARLLTTTPSTLQVTFDSTSAMYYDPGTLIASASWAYSESGRLLLQLDYEMWARFQAPVIGVNNPTSDSGISIGAYQNPIFPYQNIIVPRIGHELVVGRNTFRAGYSYRQSFMATAPNDSGNYLDPSKHIFTAGFGRQFDHLMGVTVPVSLDFNVAVHRLIPQTISKSPGNETGNLAESKVGAPGYEASGWVFGGGVSLTLLF